MKTRPLAERFWEKVQRSAGCWTWTAGRNENGYGTIQYGKPRMCVLAHRVAWELTHGRAPDEMDVCHTCDNPACVRPEHLFLGTHLDNMRDMVAKGRAQRRLALRTHCHAGHEYTTRNTRVWRGHRVCRRCHAISVTAANKKRSA